MPFIYRNLTLAPGDGEDSLLPLVAARIGVAAGDIRDFHIVRKGIDARRKPRIKLIYSVSFTVRDEKGLRAGMDGCPGLEWRPEPQPVIFAPVRSHQRIVIVGSGPAGLFAALRLAEYGLNATIVERGQPVEQRALDVQRFWKEGILDPESNVQFGEGGAGTFSDGKLTSRSGDPLISYVLERLVAFGAPPEICYLAKPHIGTDRLRRVIASIRQHLLEKGFRIRFGCRMSDVSIHAGKISAIVVNDDEELPCDLLILATGHSSRDTYGLLNALLFRLNARPLPWGCG
jgi:uncharacterized FAD-dependent dehydrogenase